MQTLRDTWVVFQRYFGLLIRNPVWVVIGVSQPVLYLVLFAPLLPALATLPGFPPGGAYNVFVPGLLIQLGLFGAFGVGFNMITELRTGVVERIRVTPVSRVAVLLGRSLRDVATLLFQSLLLIVIAIPFGLRVNPIGLLITLGLVALIGLVTVSCSYGLALWLRSEDGFAPLVFSVTLPMLLLSGVLLPLSLAPAWLRYLAALNPLSYAVDAARAVFNDRLGDPSVFTALILMTVLASATMLWSARLFGRTIG